MTKEEKKDAIEAVFNGFVFTAIETDIERELWLARNPQVGIEEGRPGGGGGNLLAALGLVSYTEFLGSFIKCIDQKPHKNFNDFLEYMGAPYKEFVDSHKNSDDVYDIYRNGLAHEYGPKRDSVIAMFGDVPCGLYVQDGKYVFVVERYFNDFKRAASKVYEERLSKPDLPPHLIRRLFPKHSLNERELVEEKLKRE